MSEPIVEWLGELSAVVDGAFALGLSTAGDRELKELRKGVETARRQLDAVLADCLGQCSGRMESRGRSEGSAAKALGGELGLPAGAVRSLIGAGKRAGGLGWDSLAAGRITAVQERTIAAGAAELGEEVVDEDRCDFERRLVALAEGGVGPGGLRNAAERALVGLDPHRQNRQEEQQQRKRAAIVRAQSQDGMSGISVSADPQLRALLDAVLSRWGQPGDCIAAAPDPETGRMPDRDQVSATDTRTPAQRAHDGLKHALALALEADTPARGTMGGVASIVVTVTPEQMDDIDSGGGAVTTNAGTRMSARQAVSLAGRRSWFLSLLADGRQELHRIEVDKNPSARLASSLQRLVLYAHYGGCTHPECDAPAARCQAHHVKDYATGGPTTLSNLCLVCPTHHGWVGDSADKWTTTPDPECPGSPIWMPPATADLATRVATDDAA